MDSSNPTTSGDAVTTASADAPATVDALGSAGAPTSADALASTNVLASADPIVSTDVLASAVQSLEISGSATHQAQPTQTDNTEVSGSKFEAQAHWTAKEIRWMRKLYSFRDVVRRLCNDGCSEELQELMVEAKVMSEPFWKLLEPGEYRKATQEEYDTKFDSMYDAMYLVQEALKSQVLCGDLESRINIHRLKILKGCFPEDLPLDIVSDEEKLELIESAKGRKEEIERVKSEADEIWKAMGYSIKTVSPILQ